METSTITSVTPLVTMAQLHSNLFKNATAGIDDSQGARRLNSEVNHVKWLTGHVVSTRYMLLNLCGRPAQEPFPSLFEKGKGLDSDAEYPSMQALLADWDALSEQLAEQMDQITEEQANGPAPFQVPTTDQTFRGVLTFFLHHEAYHIGQIGILRKYLGHEAMSYQ